jgi:hypothetical protein
MIFSGEPLVSATRSPEARRQTGIDFCITRFMTYSFITSKSTRSINI